MQEEKNRIRTAMRERRNAISKEQRREVGHVIARKLLNDHTIGLFLKTWRISLYLSTEHEIPTRYIARAVWEAGREICVPAWSKTEQAYRLYLITPRTKLIKGRLGIREPLERIPVLPWDTDVFILPGLAFDLQGGRLGFGKGIYDHILSKANPCAIKIALCYDWQILDQPLPQEPRDIQMDWIVSDKRVVNCRAQAKEARARVASHE